MEKVRKCGNEGSGETYSCQCSQCDHTRPYHYCCSSSFQNPVSNAGPILECHCLTVHCYAPPVNLGLGVLLWHIEIQLMACLFSLREIHKVTRRISAALWKLDDSQEKRIVSCLDRKTSIGGSNVLDRTKLLDQNAPPT